MRSNSKTRAIRRCQDMIALAEHYRNYGTKYELDVKKRVAPSMQSVLFKSIICRFDKKV